MRSLSPEAYSEPTTFTKINYHEHGRCQENQNPHLMNCIAGNTTFTVQKNWQEGKRIRN